MCICFFVQEIDPCKDISDEDIRLAIQNATGPRSALFVPEVIVNWMVLYAILSLFPCSDWIFCTFIAILCF